MDRTGLLDRLAGDFGVFTTAEAKASGMDGRSIATAVRRGDWHRIRRGAFVSGPDWRAADARTRHLITAAAIHRSYGDRVAFTHATAALIHGVDIWDVDLGRVHVTRLDRGSGRTERDIKHHEGFPAGNDDVVRVGGWLVVPPARAALETGMFAGAESALVTLDSVLHLGLASMEELENLFEVVEHWPKTQHLHVPIRLMDGLAESVGESRCRWMFWWGGVPRPVLQYVVRDERGEIIARTDFAWPLRRLLGEFDGKVKYGRTLRPGQDPGDVVFGEKVREDAARAATRSLMVRFTWPDLARPDESCRRVTRLLDAVA
ncbi:hypothetical protein D9V37_09210 [Nocardioides mangrovicus]|uniref:AbiEi antitoxin N-terminal domain-containing protein n=1 Tax=Nocardioides mangrovicus TaxID=2478913 RepID=A0A3L8P5I7_9ACTN|nr:type IV toxin-antitoxin system AbiEi family antitoxin domain-containing protein [Nocardioides mangrovicus]RLV50033.1 hypothetical protein D9V37_09210 [Nocardioides mangrovicus]